MSTVNAVTIYAENLQGANLVVGNTSSNLIVTANSIAISVGNVSINSTAINVVSPLGATQNTTINATALTANTLKLNGTDYNGIIGDTVLVDYQVFTNPLAANFWYKPAWAQDNDIITIQMWGGGGGSQTTASVPNGGGGGSCIIVNKLASECNAVCNVVVGSGGVGTTTAGISGGVGGSSIFYFGNSSQSIVAYGGGAGGWNNASAHGYGGGGGGWFSTGLSANTLSVGGSPLGAVAGSDSTFGGGGGANSAVTQGGMSVYGGGGGGGGGTSGTAANKVGGASVYGGGGGGGGTGVGGVSIFGGNGGGPGVVGFAPGGGGGASNTVAANGAHGEVRVWVTGQARAAGDVFPYYFITPNTSLLYEGNSISFSITTVNVANGTTLYYTLNNSSTATSADFTAAVNGSVVINGGANSFTLTASGTDTANEAFFFDLRTTSSTGDIVANSQTITLVPALGQQLFTTNGSFVVPTTVNRISVVAIGGGGGANNGGGFGAGGGGGALSYTNQIVVTPGETLTVIVGLGGQGANGGDSSISRGANTFILAKGGLSNKTGGAAASGNGAVKYSGGNGGDGDADSGGGGGGAAGYSGDGGNGGAAAASGTAGTGGAGGGGGGGKENDAGGGGGGVGVLGQGSSGSGGDVRGGGGRGSGGVAGSDGGSDNGGTGGLYGGGGGGEGGGTGGVGANGAVRIIWGPGRAFPNTSTTDV